MWHMTAQEFLAQIDGQPLSSLDRALALLWWAGRDNPALGMSAKEIGEAVEAAGHPRQNATRLHSQLAADRRTSKVGSDGWRLHPRTRRELASQYAFALEPRRAAPSDSVLPRELFGGTRGYIERVVHQVNASYDAELWDCCAVMCRRLLETLVIEVYEKLGRAGEIRSADGHFLMFNGLIAFVEQGQAFHLGRNAVKGLKDHKTLGDQSAHNRRFTANRNDIDRVRDGLRIAAEELLHLAELNRTSA
jgi:hypothetical protein